MSSSDRVDVIGVRVNAVDMARTLDEIGLRLVEGTGGYVCFTNVHAAVTARSDVRFRDATNHSFLSVADGKPVSWVGHMRSRNLGHVPGPDLMMQALRRFPSRRHFFYGASPQVLEKLRDALQRDVPGLNICGMYSPPFRPLTDDELRGHFDLIRAAGAELVWVGLGAPKQELWMASAWRSLAPAVLFGVGAAFDFSAGTIARAPLRLRRLGLEWLHRLWSEPRRLWRRYLTTNSLFVGYLIRDFFLRPPDAISKMPEESGRH